MNIKIVLAFLFLFLLSGCWGRSDPEVYRNYKCTASAKYLDRNADLMRNAAAWRNRNTPPPETKDEAVEREKMNVAMMTTAIKDFSENGNLSKKKLIKYYESDYCKTMLDEYQDVLYGQNQERELAIISKNKEVEKSTARRVAYFSQSMVDSDSKEVSCEKFNEQYDVAFVDPMTRGHADLLQAGLKNTIKDSISKLKSFQSRYVSLQIEGRNLHAIASEIRKACPNGDLLSNRMAELASVKEQVSDRSLALSKMAEEMKNESDCGDDDQIFCLSSLRKNGVERALQFSKICDGVDNENIECKIDADALFSISYEFAKKQTLEVVRAQIEYDLKNPSSGLRNLQDKLHLGMESCKRDAIRQGLRGDAYYAYEKNTCAPQVIHELLEPKRRELTRVDEILREGQQKNKVETSIREKIVEILEGIKQSPRDSFDARKRVSLGRCANLACN